MVARTYTTNPQEIYTLELQKLQRCFSQMEQVGEEVSQLDRVSWRHVEHLRHVNFILEEARQASESLLNLRR